MKSILFTLALAFTAQSMASLCSVRMGGFQRTNGFFGTKLSVGDVIKIYGTYYSVAGLVGSSGPSLEHPFEGQVVNLRRIENSKLFNSSPQAPNVAVDLRVSNEIVSAYLNVTRKVERVWAKTEVLEVRELSRLTTPIYTDRLKIDDVVDLDGSTFVSKATWKADPISSTTFNYTFTEIGSGTVSLEVLANGQTFRKIGFIETSLVTSPPRENPQPQLEWELRRKPESLSVTTLGDVVQIDGKNYVHVDDTISNWEPIISIVHLARLDENFQLPENPVYIYRQENLKLKVIGSLHLKKVAP